MQNSHHLAILITDDDDRNRALLTTLLKTLLAHIAIYTAEDGNKAIALVQAHMQENGANFDFIFMDYQMPGMNGQATTSAIRQLEKKAKLKKPSLIITWSSAKSSPYVGADDWLVKPPAKRDLQNLLQTYLSFND